ncbi:DNA helicase [Sarracenia purpurea var. burkii]
MADKKQKQQPLSLNERHNRVLQGLSASHARPHSKPHPSPQGDKQSKVKLDLSDDFPRFSGITDFDCRSPVEMKTSKFEVKGSSKALVNEQEGGRENRIAIYDPQPNLSIIANGEKNPWRIKIDGKASSEDLLDGEEYAEEKQPMKIKMQGRRRLCKVSSNDDNHDCDDGKKGNANDDSAFSGLADFDSPPALRYAVERGTGGGDEIRDILNDLSSRLEILSIEKKCAPEMVDLTEESLALVKDEDYNQTKKEKFPEYTSAAASFSLTSDLSDCSSDAANQSMVGGVIETGVDADEENESEVNNFVGGVSRSKNVGRQKKNETKSVRGRSVPMWQTFAAKVEGQDEQDEDCVILSGKKIVKEVESTDSSFSSDPSNPSLDASNQSVVGGGIETWVNKYQEESDQENESLFDNSVGRLSAGNGQKKNKTKRVSGKSVPMRQTFAAKFEGQDEEDDDCVVWSEKKKVKEVVRQCGNFQKRFDDSDKVDVLDDCSDDSNENSITLRGPKSTYMLPSKIAKMLYPHQRDGMKWLWSLHCQRKGGILGDDMGLGKTIQDKGILLTTYDIVRNNAKSLRGDSYFHDEISEDNITWDYMILDEV